MRWGKAAQVRTPGALLRAGNLDAVAVRAAALQTLRPFAYHFLAELVHHVRLDLKIPQVRSRQPCRWRVP